MTDEASERQHATLSPSSAHRWSRCAGSVNAERGLPDTAGIEAAEGTVFHEYAEYALSLGLDPEVFPTGHVQIINGHAVSYNEEMIENMRTGLAYIRNIMEKHPDAILYVEQRVPISKFTSERGGFGTSDVCIIIPSIRKIIVFDWKYGKIAVSPVESDQLTLYGLGCWEKFAGEYFVGVDPAEVDVDLIIWQPRIPTEGGKWPTNMAAMLEHGERLYAAGLATKDPNAKRTAGEKQCQWCKAAGKCPENADWNLGQYKVRREDIEKVEDYNLEMPDPDFSAFTPDQRAFIVLHRKQLVRWINSVESQLMRDIQKGDNRFAKIITGKPGHRAYKPGTERAVADKLVELIGVKKAFETNLISPTAAQDLLGKKQYELYIKQYVFQPPGKPTIVPITDPRPSMKIEHSRSFDELFDEDDEL